MTTTPINPLDFSSTQGISQSFGQAASNAMNGDDFMLLLLAQLKHQNPMEPMNDNELMAQFTQLNSLNELQNIGQALKDLANSDKLPQASNLIGKQVEVASADGQGVVGVVSGVSLVNDQIMLSLGDQELPLDDLISVTEVEQAE